MPLIPKDILFLTLALSSAALTVFLSLLLYYIISGIRDARALVKTAKERFETLTNFVDRFKDKTEAAATTASAVSRAIIEVVEYARARKAKQKKRSGFAKKDAS